MLRARSLSRIFSFSANGSAANCSRLVSPTKILSLKLVPFCSERMPLKNGSKLTLIDLLELEKLQNSIVIFDSACLQSDCHQMLRTHYPSGCSLYFDTSRSRCCLQFERTRWNKELHWPFGNDDVLTAAPAALPFQILVDRLQTNENSLNGGWKFNKYGEVNCCSRFQVERCCNSSAYRISADHSCSLHRVDHFQGSFDHADIVMHAQKGHSQSMPDA